MSLNENALNGVAAVILVAVLANGCADRTGSQLRPQDRLSGRPEEATGTYDKAQIVNAKSGTKTFAVPYMVTPDGYAIIQGDMIIGTRAQLQSTVEARGLFLLEPALWPRGVVKYKISNSLPNQNRVLNALAHWEQKTAIRFSPARSSDRDYVMFKRSPDSNSCSANVGYHTGVTPVELGDACAYGNVVHEIGHVLGVGHEHMRSDQRRYITRHMENAKPHTEHNFEPMPLKYADIGNYCYGSIMHYPKTAHSKNNKPTIVPTDRNARIGQRDGLAACDISLIRTMYRSEFAKR